MKKNYKVASKTFIFVVPFLNIPIYFSQIKLWEICAKKLSPGYLIARAFYDQISRRGLQGLFQKLTARKEKSNMDQFVTRNGKLYKVVFTKYITRGGKRIYHPKGGLYRFEVAVK